MELIITRILSQVRILVDNCLREGEELMLALLETNLVTELLLCIVCGDEVEAAGSLSLAG